MNDRKLHGRQACVAAPVADREPSRKKARIDGSAQSARQKGDAGLIAALSALSLQHEPGLVDDKSRPPPAQALRHELAMADWDDGGGLPSHRLDGGPPSTEAKSRTWPAQRRLAAVSQAQGVQPLAAAFSAPPARAPREAVSAQTQRGEQKGISRPSDRLTAPAHGAAPIDAYGLRGLLEMGKLHGQEVSVQVVSTDGKAQTLRAINVEMNEGLVIQRNQDLYSEGFASCLGIILVGGGQTGLSHEVSPPSRAASDITKVIRQFQDATGVKAPRLTIAFSIAGLRQTLANAMADEVNIKRELNDWLPVAKHKPAYLQNSQRALNAICRHYEGWVSKLASQFGAKTIALPRAAVRVRAGDGSIDNFADAVSVGLASNEDNALAPVPESFHERPAVDDAPPPEWSYGRQHRSDSEETIPDRFDDAPSPEPQRVRQHRSDSEETIAYGHVGAEMNAPPAGADAPFDAPSDAQSIA